MKCVFLDIDGVLVNRASLKERSGRKAIADSKCVYALNWLTDVTGAVIVLSSSWRFCGIEEMRLIFKHWGVRAELIDCTPDLTKKRDSGVYEAVPRGDEIQLWLNQNGAPESFVIIDDECDMGGLRDRLVRTVFDIGLTERDAQLAVQLLREAA